MNAPQSEHGLTRREFLQTSAVGGSLSVMAVAARSAVAVPSRPPAVQRVARCMVDGDAKTLCGLPRQGGIKGFGGGELALLYWRTSRTSQADAGDAADRWTGRAEMILRRSIDGGATWPAEREQTLWSNAAPPEQRAEFLCRDSAERPVLDMLRPDAMFFFGRTPLVLAKSVRQTLFDGYTAEWSLSARQGLPPDVPPGVGTAFQIRSGDRGRSWERVPLIIEPPSRIGPFWLDNHPPATMPDGALVTTLESDGALWLYGSESQGMTWQFLSQIAQARPGGGKPSRAGLVVLPDGRLQCYLAQRERNAVATYVAESEDCFRWTTPRLILAGADDPWPLRLQDGRIVVVCALRHAPAGLAAVVSNDDGRTWSDPALVRDDLKGPEIDSPVAVELEQGRIFAACGAHSIAGSIFQLS